MTVFNPATHRGLFATSGTEAERLWWPDLVSAVLANLGLYDVVVSNAAPTDLTKLWFDPDDGNAAPGVLKYYDGTTWRVMSPTRHAQYLDGWLPPSSWSLANRTTFSYTGADQDYTVPAGAKWMRMKLWGANAGNDAAGGNNMGGFVELIASTEEIAALAPGSALKIVVGQYGGQLGVQLGTPGIRTQAGTYGFGGGCAYNDLDGFGYSSFSGGGLAGVFSGSGAVAASDSARAIAVAGGAGGGAGSSSPSYSGGGGGGSVTSGGQGTMTGLTSTAPAANRAEGGGGGGYTGGGNRGVAGRTSGGFGGANFIMSGGIWSPNLGGTDTTASSGVPIAAGTRPNTGDSDYVVTNNGIAQLYWA